MKSIHFESSKVNLIKIFLPIFFHFRFLSYVIVENLRYLLYPYSSSFPVYFGHRFKPHTNKQGYASGGAGYVLSKEALMRLIEKGIPDETGCKQADNGAEDIELGKKCLFNFFPSFSFDLILHFFLPNFCVYSYT